MWGGHDRQVLYDKNVIEKITKMEGYLNRMRQRNLTLEGNILISKSFGLSQIIFALQNQNIHNTELQRIERVLCNFIWRGRDKIKRSTLKQNKLLGGLNAWDIYKVNKYFKIKAFLRYTHFIDNHPVKLSWGNRLWNSGYKYNGELQHITQQAPNKAIKQTNKSFTDQCVMVHRKHNGIIIDKLKNNIQYGMENNKNIE